MTFQVLLAIVTLLTLFGCDSAPVANNAPAVPAGYVAQEQLDDLQGRFEKLLAEYKEKVTKPAEESEQQVAELNLKVTQLESENTKLKEATEQSKAGGENLPAKPDITSIESNVAKAPRWEKISRGEERRVYGHPVGVKVEFWTDEYGVERMMWRYRIADEDAKGVGTAIWLLVIGVGGNNEAIYSYNSKRLSDWHDAPTPILPLKGGVIYAEIDGGDAVFNLYGSI